MIFMQATFLIAVVTLIACQTAIGLLLFLVYKESRKDKDPPVRVASPGPVTQETPSRLTGNSGGTPKIPEKVGDTNKPKQQLNLSYTPKKLKGF